ncbi:MAG: hypothetical protein M3Y72_18350 [Acidobacteriota bacterium]|nr:hypothetical protein [Acidobacteriota bacterium]MDQ2842958.1 hypothetical protein [Acidobacteriota bacterium]
MNVADLAVRSAVEIDTRIREGKFQRWLSLIAAGASALSGLEVAYEHYRGSYSRRVMYTPVALSVALTGGGIAGFFSKRAAKTLLQVISVVTFADGLLGFYFHVRGIQRKPGGWRLPIVNMVMGPPVFAPLLFGVSAYLGFLASLMQRDDEGKAGLNLRPAHKKHWAFRFTKQHDSISWEQDIREGRFQKQLAIATAIATFFSGFEAWYSHYKNNFRYKVQWTPVVLSPLLITASLGAVKSRKVAHTWLPALSLVAVVNGAVGFFFHARGVARRPGGLKRPLYNIIYGPPVFAPLLFAASGFLGLLASLLRREERS